jgi:hypothetical protein
MYKTIDLIVNIKRRMFEWLGHVMSMGQTRVAKENLESKAERRVGRLRLR